jgi:uncharacterized membrane protein
VLLPAILVGIGLAGTLDEVLLHQLLRWHHFYTDGGATGLITDGIFHVFSTAALVAGLLMMWRRDIRPGQSMYGGILIGAGGFNLYDGTIQHKLLKLHEVREGAHPETPYDVVFIGVALAILLAGIWLRRSAVPQASEPPRAT